MCHSTCLTCSTEAFNSCLSCLGTNVLYNSVCYCSQPWHSDCTSGTRFLIQESSFRSTFVFFSTFLNYCFIFGIVLLCLKIRLPLTYRVLSGLQAMSLLIYSHSLHLDYEDFYMLRTFNLLSGPYNLSYRLETISNSHAIQTYILIAFFIVLLLALYYPIKAFYKKYESYSTYLKDNALEFLENFYYFGGKMMFVFIGMYISSSSNQISVIINVSVFSLIIVGVFVRLISEYHSHELKEEIFQAPFYVYVMLANAAYIGLPLAESPADGSTSMLVLIFCIPAALLLLIAVLNKEVKIRSMESISFFVVEALMLGLTVCLILLDDQMKTYVLLITCILAVLVVFAEAALVYWGGIEHTAGNYEHGANKSVKNSTVHPLGLGETKNNEVKEHRSEHLLLSEQNEKGAETKHSQKDFQKSISSRKDSSSFQKKRRAQFF